MREVGEHTTFQRLFVSLKDPEVSPGFSLRVLARVSLASARRAQRRFFAFCSLACACSAASVVAVVYTGREIAASNFYAYLSLAFSDFTLVTVAWKEFAFSLVESLPLVGLTFVGLAIFTVLICVRFTLRYAQTKTPMQFA